MVHVTCSPVNYIYIKWFFFLFFLFSPEYLREKREELVTISYSKPPTPPTPPTSSFLPSYPRFLNTLRFCFTFFFFFFFFLRFSAPSHSHSTTPSSFSRPPPTAPPLISPRRAGGPEISSRLAKKKDSPSGHPSPHQLPHLQSMCLAPRPRPPLPREEKEKKKKGRKNFSF